MPWQRKLGLVLSTLILLILGGTVAWRVLLSPPAWYRPPDPLDEDAVTLAELVEQRLLEETHQIRPADRTWTVRVRDHQVNAWLALRFPKWLARERHLEWPERLGTPQVRFEERGISLALPLREAGRTRTFVLTVQPMLTADGELRFRIERVAVGRLPLPGSPVENFAELLAARMDHQDEIELGNGVVLSRLVMGEDALTPMLRLADGRRLRLEAVAISDGALDLTARTIPASRDDD